MCVAFCAQLFGAALEFTCFLNALSSPIVSATSSLTVDFSALLTTLLICSEVTRKPRRKRRRKKKRGGAAADASADAGDGYLEFGGDECSTVTGDGAELESISTADFDLAGRLAVADEFALAEFLATRPSLESLIAQNIIRDPAEFEARRTAMAAELDKRLQARPTPSEMVEKHVLLGPVSGAQTPDPSIREKQDAVRRLHTRDHLARSLRNRLTLDDLVQRNIVPRADGGVKKQVEALSDFLEKRPSVASLLQREVIKHVSMWTQVDVPSPSPPAPRNCHTMNLVNRRLYLLGGYNSPESSLLPHVLDVDHSSWHRPLCRSAAGFMPVPRYAHATVSLREAFLVIFGGYSSPVGYATSGTWLNDIWMLDLRSHADRAAAAIAAGEPAASIAAGARTSYLHAATTGPVTSLPPGFGARQPSRSSKQPTAVPSVTRVRASKNGAGTASASAAAGTGSSSPSPDDSELTWYLPPIQSNPPAPRAAHSQVLMDGDKMVIFGGNDGAGLYNDTWQLDLSVSPLQWKQLLTLGAPPSPRSGHSAVCDSSGKLMVVFGGGEGWGADCFNDLLVLDTTGVAADADGNDLVAAGGSPIWVRPSFTGTPPAPRTGHSAVLLGSRMFIFGGGNAVRSLNDLHILDISTMTWSRPSDAGALPTARAGHAVCAAGEYMLLFGGAKSDGSCYNDLYILDADFRFYPTDRKDSVAALTSAPSDSGDGDAPVVQSSTSALQQPAAATPPLPAKSADPQKTAVLKQAQSLHAALSRQRAVAKPRVESVPEAAEETDSDDDAPDDSAAVATGAAVQPDAQQHSSTSRPRVAVSKLPLHGRPAGQQPSPMSQPGSRKGSNSSTSGNDASAGTSARSAASGAAAPLPFSSPALYGAAGVVSSPPLSATRRRFSWSAKVTGTAMLAAALDSAENIRTRAARYAAAADAGSLAQARISSAATGIVSNSSRNASTSPMGASIEALASPSALNTQLQSHASIVSASDAEAMPTLESLAAEIFAYRITAGSLSSPSGIPVVSPRRDSGASNSHNAAQVLLSSRSVAPGLPLANASQLPGLSPPRELLPDASSSAIHGSAVPASSPVVLGSSSSSSSSNLSRSSSFEELLCEVKRQEQEDDEAYAAALHELQLWREARKQQTDSWKSKLQAASDVVARQVADTAARPILPQSV